MNSNAHAGNSKRPLPMGIKLGYGVGGFADNLTSMFFSSFFLFFLTDTVGIHPAFAGTITFIAVLWDAITDPFIGHFSDKLTWKSGRRRPLMLLIAIPFGLSFAFLFTAVEGTMVFKQFYYIIFCIIFWTCFTIFSVPFNAFGAEITDDFNNRNTLRSFIGVFSLISIFFATSVSMMILGHFSATASPEQGWKAVGWVNGTLTIFAVLLTWRFTKGWEKNPSKLNHMDNKNPSMVNTFIKILKVKSFRFIAIAQILFCIGMQIVQGITIYLLTNNLGFDEGRTAMYYTINLAISIMTIPIILNVANKIGKRKAYILLITIGAIMMGTFAIFGINSMTSLILFSIFQATSVGTYQTLCISMVLDCCDLIEYSTGKRLEGLTTSLASLMMKGGFAIGTWITGLLISATGYMPNALEQSASALKGILLIATVAGPIFYILSIFVVKLYKLDKNKFDLLHDVLARRRQGEDARNKEIDALIH